MDRIYNWASNVPHLWHKDQALWLVGAAAILLLVVGMVGSSIWKANLSRADQRRINM